MTKQDILKALECCIIKRSCSGFPMFEKNNLHCSRKLLEACYAELNKEKQS